MDEDDIDENDIINNGKASKTCVNEVLDSKDFYHQSGSLLNFFNQNKIFMKSTLLSPYTPMKNDSVHTKLELDRFRRQSELAIKQRTVGDRVKEHCKKNKL